MGSRLRLAVIPVIAAALSAFSSSTVPVFAAPAGADADSVAAAKTVTDFHAALSRGDSLRALGLLAIDAVILESGTVESRAEYRSHHLPADIEFAKAVAEKRGPIQVRVKGNVAWTSAASVTKGEFKGRAIDSTGAESMVLTKEASRWKIQSIHWSSRRRSTSS